MNHPALALAVAALVATASPSLAQPSLTSVTPSVGMARQPSDPLPRFAADLRAATVGLPTGLGWTPPVPTGTQIPRRTLGLEAGAHVYVVRYKLGGIGLGSTILLARGKTTPSAAAAPGTTAGTAASTLPAVTTTLRGVVPQISLNFGHRLGWSYISGGIGRTRVKGEVSQPATPTSSTTTESDWTRTLNYGGGARWFINDRVAFSLDLRWYKIAAVAETATRPPLPRQSLLVAGGGISFK